VVASVTMAQMIIAESRWALSAWACRRHSPHGEHAGDGQTYLTSAWWVSAAPGGALMLTVLSTYLVSDFAAGPDGSAAGLAYRPPPG